MFHFTKDKSSFSHFALEMMAFDSNINHPKKVGTDMDESIYNDVKDVIPEVNQLHCVRHLRQLDKKNLTGFLVKQNTVHQKEIASKTRYTVIGKSHLKSLVWQSLKTNLILMLNPPC